MWYIKKHKNKDDAARIMKELFDEYIYNANNKVDLFRDKKILLNLIDDRLYEYPQKKSLIRIGIMEGIHCAVKESGSFTKRYKLGHCISTINKKYGIDESMAVELVSNINYAVNGYGITAYNCTKGFNR